MSNDHPLLPWLAIRLVQDMNRARFYALMHQFVTPNAVFGASAREIACVRGFDLPLAERVLRSRDSEFARRQMDRLQSLGIELVTSQCAGYPFGLTHSALLPPLLFVRGSIRPEDKYSIALVGSRHATTYGRSVARELAGGLARYGLTIVSGFARGIDGEAHHAAIKAGGRTLAVLGNGLDVCYPSEHHALVDLIAQNGALISEYPLGTPPERFNFPERNHVIAALAMGTVVVEAAEKSGSLITARLAVEENRFIFAVPGDITRNNSRGANSLIQNGARMVQRPRDVLIEMKDVLRGYLDVDAVEAAEAEPEKKPAPEKQRRNPTRDWVDDIESLDDEKLALFTTQPQTDDRQTENRLVLRPDPAPPPPMTAAATASAAPVLPRPVAAAKKKTYTADEEFILQLLHHEAMVFDELADQAFLRGIDVPRLTTLLMKLELKQAVRQLPGRYYVRFS